MEKEKKALEFCVKRVYNNIVSPWGCKGFDGDFEIE